MRTKRPDQAEKILEVAVRFFSTHRFHEARMEDIAAAANVGKGTLYRYFQDKDELYLALLKKAADEMTAKLDRDVVTQQESRPRLVALARTILDFFYSRPHLLDLIQHAETLQSIERPFPWRTVREQTIKIATDAFEELNRDGQLVGSNPQLAALLLLGGLRAVIRLLPFEGCPSIGEKTVECFLYKSAPAIAQRRD